MCDVSHSMRTLTVNSAGLVAAEKTKPRSPTLHSADRERQMTYLSGVVHRWPMLRTAAGIILTFVLAVPLAWAVSDFLVYELVGH
jgi:hypothetical protein